MTKYLMEAICAVVRNKGAAGVGGMTIRDLLAAVAAHWPEIEKDLLGGRYQPQPVRRVSIPKPDDGERHLCIPNDFDRLIQQAVLQRLQPLWDPTFSEHSYGFRPGRSAHQAVVQAQAYVIEG
jgi:RNA-directed DNA polymerase